MSKAEIIKELFRNKTVPKKRRSINTTHPFDIFAIDLIDMGTRSAEINNGLRYIMVIEDIFSRYAWTIPLKSKDSKTTLDALKSVLSKYTQKPNLIHADKGSEFWNADWDKYLKQNNIQLYSTFGEHKSAFVERLNRTLKRNTTIEKHLQDTNKWSDVIEDVLEKYNNTIHRSIKTTPKKLFESPKLQKVEKKKNIAKIKSDIKIGKTLPLKFDIDDIVRISIVKNILEKSSNTPNWSKEVFKIVQISKTNPVTYKIEDENRNILQGSFYTEELQKSKQPFEYKIPQPILVIGKEKEKPKKEPKKKVIKKPIPIPIKEENRRKPKINYRKLAGLK